MNKYNQIFENAIDNYGLITSAQLSQLNVSRTQIQRYVHDGRLERIGRGLYRISYYSPEGKDIYAQAVLLVDKEAFLFGESVLAMLELCPTNPTRIFVGTDKRIRKNIRKSIIIVQTTAKNITSYEGIRSQNVEDSIFECINSVRSSRLITATNNALKEGYIDKSTCEKLLARINNE